MRVQQFVELLHRHVLRGAGEPVGELLVQPIGLDTLGDGGGGCEAFDERIEGALGVECQGIEMGGVIHHDPTWFGGEPVQSQRVFQAARRIDGDHRGAAGVLRGCQC